MPSRGNGEPGETVNSIIRILDGAEGESRTPTRIPPLDPEPSASTNSATSAQPAGNMIIYKGFVKQFFEASLKSLKGLMSNDINKQVAMLFGRRCEFEHGQLLSLFSRKMSRTSL
jgi:hypothetical protein